MGHYVYIAASSRLLDWSNETLGRSAIKVGESWNPAEREMYLSGRDPHDGGRIASCCGCSDWKVVVKVMLKDENDALDLEGRFKAAFEPLDVYDRHRPPCLHAGRSAGESDLVLLPEKQLIGADLAALDEDVRHLYLAARARMYDAVRAAPEEVERYVDDEEHDHGRERDMFLRDEEDTRVENQDSAARLRESGSYYED